jgi:hypothetical protein
MPVPGGPQPLVPIELVRETRDRTAALIWQTGEYTLSMADGQTRVLHVPDLPEPFQLAGSWTVDFDSQLGGPGMITMDSLMDWTKHTDPAVKYYSGTATYRKPFDLPPSLSQYRLYLELGEVHDLAIVRINGQDLGTLWNAPWQVELTDAVRPGQNTLEIDVVNCWNNRLVGDAHLPPEERHTFLAVPTVKQNAPLLPAGLQGPVMVRAARQVEPR